MERRRPFPLYRWVLLGVACVAACRPAPQPNVILVTLDTTRADHLGCYGYHERTSPNLDRFAATAALYEHAYATSSWTLASHASLFTGLLPMQHGAQTAPEGPVRRLGYGVRPLADSFTTLAELLAAAGYRTAAVVGGPALSRELGVAQGFADYEDDLDGPGEKRTGKRAEVVADRAIAHIERFGRSPYFLFVNFFDPHLPYRPPSPYDAELPPDSDHPGGKLLETFLGRLNGRPGAVPPPPHEAWVQTELDAIRTAYDAEIAYMDHHLGRLLSAVAASPRADDTLIVITGDHGESFGEHDFFSHGAHLYEDNVRVPLIVRYPDEAGAGTRLPEPVQNHRVFASVLDSVGLPLPSDVALRGLGVGGGAIVTEVRRSDANVRLFGAAFDRDLRAIYAPPFKLIETSAGSVELFDLARDPDELENLVTKKQETAAALAGRLDEIVAAHPPLFDAKARAVLEPDTKDALRALGYID